MKRVLMMAGLLAGCLGAACAQRGGGHGGGPSSFHGGFSGRPTSSAPRGEFRGAPGPGFAARSSAGVVRQRSPGSRPGFYTRDRGGSRRRYAGGVPFVYGGPIGSTWLDANDPGYADNGYYGDPQQDGYAGDPGLENGNDVEQPADGPAGPLAEEPVAPRTEVAEPERAPQRPAAAPELYDPSDVTLVFKDGRPNETIRNYALTRKTLFVTDGRHREIPVADLNLEATEKINRAAGVEFQLPR